MNGLVLIDSIILLSLAYRGAAAYRPTGYRLPWKLTLTVDEASRQPLEGEFAFAFGLSGQTERRFRRTFRPGDVVEYSGLQYTELENAQPNSVEFAFVNESLCRLHSDWTALKLTEIRLAYIRRNVTYRMATGAATLEARCGGRGGGRRHAAGGLAVNGFRPQTDGPNDCYYSNVYFDHNQTVDKSCEAVCKCFDGRVDCVSMCPPATLIDPRKCRFAARLGECCETVECFEDVQNRFCDSRQSVKAYASYKAYPWTVLLHSWKHGACLATIIDEQWLLTPGYCAERPEAALIVYPEVEAGRQWRIENVAFSPSIKSPAFSVEKTLALIKLKRPIIFNDRIQKVNLPWMGICGNYLGGDCAARLASFGDGIENSLVDIVETSQCFDPFYSGNTSSYAEMCFRRRGRRSTTGCTTEDGGAVAVNSGSFHYLVAVVRKYFKEAPCRHGNDSTTADRFLKAESICPYLTWIKSFTGIDSLH